MAALHGKIALVTGASSGLGAETARLFSRQGATVFGIGRDSGRLAAVFADVDGGSYASVDVASAHACRDAVEECVREFGGLDVLVNVAGRHQMRRTESMGDDDWAEDLAVNLNGPFFLSRAALPHLLERGGNIVNVSSIAGVEGQAYSAGYCAAKHGLVGLTRALAVEYTADRLRVNAVCPGGMLTPQIEQFTAPDNPNYDLIMRTASPRGMMQPRRRERGRLPGQRCRGRGSRRRLSRRQRQGRRLGRAWWYHAGIIRRMGMTLRPSEQQAEALRRQAADEGRSMQAVALSAIDEYIARRAHTAKVADALQRVVREEARVLARLKDA